jgi:hypothetical protein
VDWGNVGGRSTIHLQRDNPCKTIGRSLQVEKDPRNGAEENVTQLKKTKESRPRVFETMADDDVDGVFGADFGIDSDEETKVEEKENRTFQSEKDFLQQKRDWKPKIETKEVITQSERTLIVGALTCSDDSGSTSDKV